MTANSKKCIQFADTRDADSVKNLEFADVISGRKAIALFSPALLVTYGGFDRDPVKEYNAFAPAATIDEEPFCIDLRFRDHVFFSGLGQSAATLHMPAINWDRRLYGIDKIRSEECFAFIRGIAFKQQNGRMFQSFSHELVLRDPTSAADNRWFAVTVFGVFTFCYHADTDKRAKVIYMENAQGIPVPKVKHFDTDEDMRAFFALRGASMFERDNIKLDE